MALAQFKSWISSLFTRKPAAALFVSLVGPRGCARISQCVYDGTNIHHRNLHFVGARLSASWSRQVAAKMHSDTSWCKGPRWKIRLGMPDRDLVDQISELEA